MDKKIVIGFVGLPGSGKSTAIKAVESLGEVVIMGDVVRNEAKFQGLKFTSNSLGKVAKELRKKYGPDIIAERSVDLIKKSTSNMIFVDGLRSMHEVEIFRKEWTFPIIVISCSPETRYERLKQRGRSDDSIDVETIRKRDEREMDFGVQAVIDNADYVIGNNGSLEELVIKTKNTVKQIKNKMMV